MRKCVVLLIAMGLLCGCSPNTLANKTSDDSYHCVSYQGIPHNCPMTGNGCPNVVLEDMEVPPYPYCAPKEILRGTLSLYEDYFFLEPEAFVPWNVVKCFGDFEGWFNCGYAYNEFGEITYTDYCYIIGDGYGNRLSLFVYKYPWEEQQFSILVPISQVDDLGNLQFTGGTRYGRAYYLSDTVVYQYFEDELQYVNWHCETHRFVLAIHQYKAGTNEFMDLLLNADTALAALDDFNRAVKQAVS